MSSAIGGVGSAVSQSQQDSTSISIPADLTPAQEAQVAQILGELSSGSITAAQAQAQISAISGSQQQPAPPPHHGHHHEMGTLSSALNLTSDQESQIASIIQGAQGNASSPQSVLSQIDAVLTPAQQQKLAQLLSPTYSSSGTQSSGGQPSLFTTTA